MQSGKVLPHISKVPCPESGCRDKMLLREHPTSTWHDAYSKGKWKLFPAWQWPWDNCKAPDWWICGWAELVDKYSAACLAMKFTKRKLCWSSHNICTGTLAALVQSFCPCSGHRDLPGGGKIRSLDAEHQTWLLTLSISPTWCCPQLGQALGDPKASLISALTSGASNFCW